MSQALCAATFMQKIVTKLCGRDIIDDNSFLKQIQNVKAQIRLNIVSRYKDMTVCSFSDASTNITAF